MLIGASRIEKYSSTILNTFQMRIMNIYIYIYYIFIHMKSICYTIPLYIKTNNS